MYYVINKHNPIDELKNSLSNIFIKNSYIIVIMGFISNKAMFDSELEFHIERMGFD